jgi:hypothetical protein
MKKSKCYVNIIKTFLTMLKLKNMKRHLQESKSKNKDEDTTTTIEENTTRRVEEEIGKKFEKH